MKTVDLQSIESFAQLLMDSNPQYIFWKNRDSVYLGCNRLYAHFCNLEDTEDIAGTTDYDYMSKAEADVCITADQEVMDADAAILNFRECVTNAHGEARWYNINKVPLKSASGEVVGVLGTMTDVTELYEKNKIIEDQAQRLIGKVKELEEKNKELEEFAYIAAHDLQEPLRNINTFSNLLKRSQSFDNDFLDHIILNSKRMSALINGLLNYSITGKNAKKKSPTNLNDLIQEVREMMQISFEGIPHEVQCDDLPSIKGYKEELISLFQNLFSNSLKYRMPGEQCIIKIYRTSHKPDKITLCFEDNGIGFEQKHARKIFQIFKRLSSASLNNGVGIGLSICLKIMKVHNGKIWAQSEKNKGTRIFLEFPK